MTQAAWDLLKGVPDPELPMVSVVDLGIVRAVRAEGDAVEVDITPTYSGCPAMVEIEQDVRTALSLRFSRVEVRTVLSPAWTTDWVTEEGRRRLAESGVAPPGPVLLQIERRVACPRCASYDVEELTPFGSTACKSMWRCRACREPFDRFKEH